MRLNGKLLVIVLVICLILGLFPSQVLALDDIDYTFNREIAIDYEVGDVPDQMFNLRNQTYYNSEGLYNATDSFQGGDITDEGVEIDWISVDNSVGNAGGSLIEMLDGHARVLNLTDNDGSGKVDVLHSLGGDESSGTFEFWLRVSDTGNNRYFYFRDGVGITKFWMLVSAGRLVAYDGLNPIQTGTFVADYWHHVRVDFECGAGSYKGLSADTWRLYFDGYLSGDFDFHEVTNHIDSLVLVTETGANGFSFFLDAVGETFNSYPIGQNILPYIRTITSIMEVDRFEFAFENPNDFYNGTDTLSGWSKTEVSDGSVVVIGGLDPLFDRELSIACQDGGDTAGITRDNIATTTGIDYQQIFYDVSVGKESGQPVGANMEFKVEFYSDDNTHVFGIKISEYGAGSIELSLWSGSFRSVRDDLQAFDILQIEVGINYEIDMATVDYYVNDSFIDSYAWALASIGKTGLKKVSALLTTADPSYVNLDNIGIYSNGSGFVPEFGYYSFNTSGIDNFSPQSHNLINVTAAGFVELGAAEGVGGLYIPESNYDAFLPMASTLNNDSIFLNTYDETPFDVDNPVMVVYFATWNLSLTQYSVEGAKLTHQDGTDYHLEFDHDNVSITESFFFVDDSHRLQFRHIANDTDLEFIEATFDINNTLTDDYAVSFTTNIDDNAIGFFRTKFISTSNIFQLDTVLRTRRVVLTQNETLTDFIVLVTDNDVDSVSGLTEGFVSAIKLISTPNIEVTVTTLNLIDMLIPLIIILIPTLLVGSLYGKSLIIPMFLLMCIILTASGMIPAWLFFIIGISASIFATRKRERVF